MFLFLHGLAMMLGFLIGGPGGSGFSHMAGSAMSAPLDSGGSMPPAPSDSGGSMPPGGGDSGGGG
jgi:hypothetical protein